jgi:Tfp pilus assembly protein PilX
MMINPELQYRCRPLSPLARAQRGVVLIIALIVLVAMSLGGVAILRSVDTATLIAGNYAFKQSTLHGANTGIEAAFQWIAANPSNLNIDNAGQGYYSWTSRLSNQRFAWESPAAWAGSKKVNNVPDAAGNTVEYVIHRLCSSPGKALTLANGTANPCATNSGSGTGAAYSAPVEGSSNVSGSSAFTTPPAIVLRVIARSSGPRNAVSYVEAMVLLPI